MNVDKILPGMALRSCWAVLTCTVLAALAATVQAQDRPQFSFTRTDDIVTLTVDPATNGTECQFRIVGSFESAKFVRTRAKRKFLSPRVSRSTDFQIVADISADVRRVGASSRRTLYVAVGERCGDTETFSRVKRLRIDASPGGLREKAWMRGMRTSAERNILTFEDAFPSLTFAYPVDLQVAPGGSRLYVVEQGGMVRVFDNDSAATSSGNFLDLGSVVRFDGEQGLLGLAFHPDYESNGYLYVHYTEDATGDNVVVRYTRDNSDPLTADASTALEILRTAQPYENHKGGQIRFGSDGYLYIALGDGGSSGDPLGNGQNRASLLGKILRIDVDNPSGGEQYGIPVDNPFAGNTDGYREEIFAYGLRNPWRFSFDPTTGALYAGDVGQNRIEEVNIITSGANYGWNIMEGTDCYPLTSSCSSDGLTLPIASYRRPLGYSVTGGAVYRGANIPLISGHYIFADFVTGRVFQLNPADQSRTLEAFDTEYYISSFGVDADNEIYALSYYSGEVLRLARSSD
ncbi:MAG: PQQ-dependent sugar dehydrogenase [Bdellovibrionota bacterium]|nr:MAG: PQQ-dependent sugar dehydrogenase [Bdellovibrionota bacterium]